MSRFWGGSSSSSDDEDYYSDSSDVALKKEFGFKDHFIDQAIYAKLDSAAWMEMGAIVQDYCNSVEFGISTDSDVARLKVWIEKQAVQFKVPFDQARFYLLVRQYANYLVLDFELDAKNQKNFSAKLNKLLPVKLFHQNRSRLGVMEVHLNDVPVAYFKVGTERQQRDMFLARLSDFFIKRMGLVDIPPLFASSVPCQMSFGDIAVKGQHELPSMDEFRVTFYNATIGSYQEKVVSVSDNMDGAIRSINGSLQPALPDWTPDKATNLELLIMLTVDLVLGARDLKNDGVKACVTQIDFEDFLEEKIDAVKDPLPDVHIPFHTDFSSKKVEKSDWLALIDLWKKIDFPALEKFLLDQKFSHRESRPAMGVDVNRCFCRVEMDLREGYVDLNPSFIGSGILSERQKTYLLKNIPRVTKALERCVIEGASTMKRLIEIYDPVWYSEELGFHMIYAAHEDSDLEDTQRNSLASSFDDKDLIWMSNVRRNGQSPSDFTGLHRCPVPKVKFSPDIVRLVDSSLSNGVGLLSASISDLTLSTSTVTSSDEDAPRKSLINSV